MASKDYDYIFGEQGPQEAAQPLPSAINMLLLGAVVVLVAVTAFLIGVMFERRSSTANAVEMASLWEVWDILEDRYYGDLPSVEERKYAAIEGVVNSLGDPYTAFARPQLAEVRRQEIDGHFGGIGVRIGVIDPLYRARQLALEGNSLSARLQSVYQMCAQRLCLPQIGVIEVFPNTPAERAGLSVGDLFIGVDGNSVEGVSTADLADRVKGEVGTQVQLTMYRPGEDRLLELSVERAIIEMPTVSSQVIDDIAYLRLASFSGVATTQLESHIQALEEENLRGVILDLRGNGGGLLSQAVSVADLFLDEGLILTQRSADDEEVLRSSDGQVLEGLPMVILIDQGTASASEVVAGALEARGRAILIGQRSFGKGVVQEVFNLSDGSQLRVTATVWFTPDNRQIQDEGLLPNIVIQDEQDEAGNYRILNMINTETGEDLGIQAALDYLREEQ